MLEQQGRGAEVRTECSAVLTASRGQSLAQVHVQYTATNVAHPAAMPRSIRAVSPTSSMTATPTATLSVSRNSRLLLRVMGSGEEGLDGRLRATDDGSVAPDEDGTLRQLRLQMVEAALDPVPFGAAAARAYGSLVAAVLEHGRQPCRRTADLMIAATAVAEGLPLLTRNPGDFAGLEDHLRVIAV